MKAVKVLAIVLIAMFSYNAVSAQTMHHKKHFKRHHHRVVKHHHIVRH